MGPQFSRIPQREMGAPLVTGGEMRGHGGGDTTQIEQGTAWSWGDSRGLGLVNSRSNSEALCHLVIV